MSSHSSPVPSDPASPDWREIEDRLDEIAAAARSTISEADFFRLLFDRIVPAAGVAGAALWIAPRPGELRLECQLHLDGTPREAAGDLPLSHGPLVEEVLAAGEPRVVTPARKQAPGLADNPTDCTLILCPFVPGARKQGVVEFFRRGQVPASEIHDYLRLLAALVELIADFDRHRELAEFHGHEEAWRKGERFALRVHESLDLNRTAYTIANEGRQLLGCDRVSVLMRRGATFRSLAISGVDLLERRAPLVRRLERLASSAAATGDPLWYSDGVADLPTEVEGALHDYVDESHCRVLLVVPVAEPRAGEGHGAGDALGVIVIEQFQASANDAELRSRATAMARHAAVALANARAHTQLPLSSVGRSLEKSRWLVEESQLPRTVLALLAAAVIVAGLALIPADFDVEVRGELQPERRRDVFASDDGVVSELLADHGRATREGEPLVVLRKPQLDLELSRVVGELQTAEKKLAAVQAERLTNARAAPDARRNVHQLTADEEELKKLLEGLREQRTILEHQRSELTVRSSLDGQALTWNLKELLEARPVQRGQALLTVADLEGPWELDLHVPDYRAGHILEARKQLGNELDVSFALTSEPGTVYQGKIVEMALSTEMDEESIPTVPVTVAFDRNEVAGLRPGATVIARIHCGRRAIGYVWLHDLFEAVQSHWWW